MKLLTSVLLALLAPVVTDAKAILGVDLGTLYMKVALVQRGAPLEIVTNLHSKRKTENMILFDSDTRFYGADANSLYGRKPTKTPSALSVMLGRDEEHPTAKVLTERHYPILPHYNASRHGVYVEVDKQEFTPEELVAMLLVHARDMTVAYGESNGNGNILPKDIVLTVPAFATQHERKALLNAAELADFNVLSLIDETTAAALNYGMDKIMEEPKILIFYNLGASSLQVSVVKFLAYEHKESKYAKNKTVGGLEVLGKAWDTTLGGSALDHRIVEYLADEFNKIWNSGKDVRQFARPMAKLRIQANKVKHVLSANKEIPIYIDALHADTALQVTLTRPKVEEMCADLLQRAVEPINDALKRANVTLAEVDGIELIGGGMRVPKIQEYIQAYLGEKMELGMHINSDESMALGASFHGANISTAFKVRHVGMADINPFAVKIGLHDLSPLAEAEEEWSKEATMFKSGGKVGVKKTIAFTHDQDVHCQLDYDEESDILPEGTQLALERYNITGIADFAAEMKEKELGPPKVSLQFELSNSGITRLVKAEAAVEETYMVEEEEEIDDPDAPDEEEEEEEEEEEATDEEAKEDGEKDDAEEASKDGEAKEGDKTATDGDDTADTKEDKKEEKEDKKEEKKDKKKKKKKKKTKTIMVEKEKKRTTKKTLDVSSYHVGRVQPYSPEGFEESRAKMGALDAKDQERMMLEASRNKVESFIYKIKNKLVDDEENIGKVTTEAQREELSKMALEAEEWMYDDGYNADLAGMEDKYAELATLADAVFMRVTELTARPAAVEALQEEIVKIEKLMTKWETTHPQVTAEERSEVLTKVEEVKTWLAEQEAEQEKVAASDPPAFLSEDLPGKTKSIKVQVTRLSKKPKPKPPKKNETSGDNETKTENETIELDEEGKETVDGETSDDAEAKEDETAGEKEVTEEETKEEAKEEEAKEEEAKEEEGATEDATAEAPDL